jgi:hypothetical protein
MSEHEISFRVPNSKYNEMILLDKYNDAYSLIAAQEGKDGNIYKRWVFPQGKNRQASEKSIPLKITLGNRTEALAMLQGFINALMGNHQGTAQQPPLVTVTPQRINVPDDDQDVPF